MWLMLFGLALFSGVHLIPAALGNIRSILVDKLGLWEFKGLFSVLTLTAIVSIVLGWRSMEPVHVYITPSWGNQAAFLLVLLTSVLFVSPYIKTNIRRIIRHPQLVGILLWSAGHLLANGDSRSLVLFAWLAVWAVLEILMINRREGAREKPSPSPAMYDVLTVAAGCIVYAVFLVLHPWLSGIGIISV